MYSISRSTQAARMLLGCTPNGVVPLHIVRDGWGGLLICRLLAQNIASVLNKSKSSRQKCNTMFIDKIILIPPRRQSERTESKRKQSLQSKQERYQPLTVDWTRLLMRKWRWKRVDFWSRLWRSPRLCRLLQMVEEASMHSHFMHSITVGVVRELYIDIFFYWSLFCFSKMMYNFLSAWSVRSLFFTDLWLFLRGNLDLHVTMAEASAGCINYVND